MLNLGVFKKRDERAEAGGADMMNEGTIGGETCGECKFLRYFIAFGIKIDTIQGLNAL